VAKVLKYFSKSFHSYLETRFWLAAQNTV